MDVKRLPRPTSWEMLHEEMIGGNPVEKHYDKFCKKFNGKKLVLTDAVKDRQGKYHEDVIYEIILSRTEK